MSNEAYDRATELANLAANAVGLAIDLLEMAEGEIDGEETKHAIPSTDQHLAAHYAQMTTELERAWERLTGRPRLQVISSTMTKIRTVRDGVLIQEKAVANG